MMLSARGFGSGAVRKFRSQLALAAIVLPLLSLQARATEAQCPQTDLGRALPISVSGSTVGTPDAFKGSCGSGGGRDREFLFTAPFAATFVIDTNGSSFDTVLYLQVGPTCGGRELACNNDIDGAANRQSQLSLALRAGETIIVVVDGVNEGSYGTFNLHITAAAPPAPTSTPTIAPSPPATWTKSVTQTPTPRLTFTAPPSATGTATRMPTHTATASPTATASQTAAATPTSTPTIAACVGDCSSDREVTVDELLTLVNIALGNASVSVCGAGDTNRDREITIDELLLAVNMALLGCSDPNQATKTIGTMGGVLEVEGARLDLLAGTFSPPQSVTLTRLDVAPPEGFEAFSPVFQIDFNGGAPSRPFTLTMKFSGEWKRAGLYCASAGQSTFEHIPTDSLDMSKIRARVPREGKCFVAAVADQSSFNCPEGSGPSRCVIVVPIAGSAAQSVIDGNLDPNPEEYRYSHVFQYADPYLQASGGLIYVTVDRDPSASAGAKLRVLMKGLPASDKFSRVSVVLDHDRFSSAHGNYVTAEDRAYQLDFRGGENRAYVGNVNPSDPFGQLPWTTPPPPTLECTPPPNSVCSAVSPILPWTAVTGAVETVHPTGFGKPDYFRLDAEFSITLPKIPLPTDGSLPGIGFSVGVRSLRNSTDLLWSGFPEQSRGGLWNDSGDATDFPLERSVFQTLLFDYRPKGKPVSILTWNVKRFTSYQHTQEEIFKSLSDADPFDDSKVSGASIGKAIAGYDVIALQEVWESDQIRVIRDAANAVDPTRPYFVVGPVQRVIPNEILPSLKSVMGDRTGGAYILSRYPIAAMGQDVFNQCVGEDCLYPKGFLWARVWLGAPDQEYVECMKDQKDTPPDETDCRMPSGAEYLDVVTTHLNAGPEMCKDTGAWNYIKGKTVQFLENLPTAIFCPYCAVIRTAVENDFYCGLRDAETVRRNQLEQIDQFLHNAGLDSRQVVITGDFNIDGRAGNEAEYLGAIQALGIPSTFPLASGGKYDTINPFPLDFGWDVDRGDLAREQFPDPVGWDPAKGQVSTNKGATSKEDENTARYDYILVRAANTMTPNHVIAKGADPVWERIFMHPPVGTTPDRLSDHMAVAASLDVAPFQDPPKYHPNWAHTYGFRVTSAVGTGDDGWAGSEEELFAQIAQWKLGALDWWKTGSCGTDSGLTWPADSCLGGWSWGDPLVPRDTSSFHGGGVHLWELDDSSPNDDYGIVWTPHGRDGMQMFAHWANGLLEVRDWAGIFTPHGWTDFRLADYAPVGYCGVDGNPTACMATTIAEIQP